MGAADGSSFVFTDFVHAAEDQDLLWSVDQGSSTVAVSVNVDQLAIHGDGVGAHHVGISQEGTAVTVFEFLGIFGKGAVDELKVARL